MAEPILIVSGPSGAGKTTVSKVLAASFDRSVHLQADAFMFSIVGGWVDPGLPDADHQNEVVGGAIAAAALQFANGGYTVILDGDFLPEGVDGMAEWSARRHAPLHYAVLRPDYATCLERVRQRRQTDPEDVDAFARLHARFADLGDREAHVVEHAGTPEDAAGAVLRAFRSGALAIWTP